MRKSKERAVSERLLLSNDFTDSSGRPAYQQILVFIILAMCLFEDRSLRSFTILLYGLLINVIDVVQPIAALSWL